MIIKPSSKATDNGNSNLSMSEQCDKLISRWEDFGKNHEFPDDLQQLIIESVDQLKLIRTGLDTQLENDDSWLIQLYKIIELLSEIEMFYEMFKP